MVFYRRHSDWSFHGLNASRARALRLAQVPLPTVGYNYNPDNWRASQVRNIGAIVGNRSASDNDWETIKKGGDSAIINWIVKQMNLRTCTIVLVGTKTYDQKWINYEIVKSWNDGKGHTVLL